MIRFTWLRFRAQAAVVFGALAALAVVLAVTGWHLARLYDTAAAACQPRGDCSAAMNAFASSDSSLQSFLRLVLLFAPALIGMFWGAPLLAREFETGTFRLAWTQDVTPTRWLAVKLGVVGLASVAAAGLLSLMVTWWSSPIDTAGMDPWAAFSQRDITPVGYAAFAFALGVTAGMLIRRTVPAMAITLAVFAAVQVVMRLWIRPRLITPARTTSPLNIAALQATGMTGAVNGRLQVIEPADIPGAWVYSSQIITQAGQPASSEPATQACTTGSGQACDAYIATLHLRQTVTYQPASRYWAFQWYETAIFLGLAVILAGACFWQIRRRRSEELHILHLHAFRKTPALERSG
jgi:ABC-type transport system involved in multi-copper enzyme maturation permease subunit